MEKIFKNSFNSQTTLKSGGQEYQVFSLHAIDKPGICSLDRLPFSIRILLEGLLRNEDGKIVTAENIKDLAGYDPKKIPSREIPYMPSRVILQDFTGVPAVVDLAAMRDAMLSLGGDPSEINPLVNSDLVIDHSIQVDQYGQAGALQYNMAKEYERNGERYNLIKWAQKSFRNFRVVPPGSGIIHQVNLEKLGTVVSVKEINGKNFAFPDTLVGTDSHTTMINGLGIIGWGVGGIEAEAVMLGQPYYMLIPEVVGMKLHGELSGGVTATDLVLTVTKVLREKGVVGKFVEYFGPGLDSLDIADRAVLSNMSPEYGATMGFFPVDNVTLKYLELTGRDKKAIDLVEAYTKEQGLFRSAKSPEPIFTDTVELDLNTIEPCMAGPKRPQDNVPLSQIKKSFHMTLETPVGSGGFAISNGEKDATATCKTKGESFKLKHGSVVIAALASCTNTSNPSLMLAAGLVAKKALERGILSRPWIKTSLAPGSQVVTEYLKDSGLLEDLEKQHFNIVGYGCTSCIGNSGPLPEPVSKAIASGKLVTASVISGNRNFEGRIHPEVKANYLASPPLVVAYALCGRIDIDFKTEPVGYDGQGGPVFLKDIWPSSSEITEAAEKALTPGVFKKAYSEIFTGNKKWRDLASTESLTFNWDKTSTYIKSPPFFKGLSLKVKKPEDIISARVLVFLGDSVTTDHISPAGAIPENGSAGQYLIAQGVNRGDFNSFGSRRGNHEVMVRGTFANIRLKNLLVPGSEGDYTIHIPSGEKTTIFEASLKYAEEKIPLIVIAGKEYGTGSSRDWAAKGTSLLGVKAVIAKSYERIHRSNLIGMGVLPLQFMEGEDKDSLGLVGKEKYTVHGISEGLAPGKILTIMANSGNNGTVKEFKVMCRLDTPVEVEYYNNGGILQTVLRNLNR